ncbi:hypothetical protein [Catenibacterium sp.]|uniref:hypothetical protein n=1 Tax=Catenibacterium sp. TaxID=2049022 RepID=UPI003AB87CFE
MDILVDNTRSRYGKFIPWLVVGTFINAFVFVVLGINNSQEMNEKIMSGEIYGSVDNNMDDQVLRIVKWKY